MNDILSIDVGTTSFKVGVFSPDLDKKCEASRLYEPNLYDFGKADIEPEKWWIILQDCCAEMKSFLRSVSVISLSVAAPGLVAMNEAGATLGPAILFFDGRSHKQAKEIRKRVGEGRYSLRKAILQYSERQSKRTSWLFGFGDKWRVMQFISLRTNGGAQVISQVIT